MDQLIIIWNLIFLFLTMASEVDFMSNLKLRLKLPVVVREIPLVFGYLRKNFQFTDDSMQCRRLPKNIMDICLIYYTCAIDEWDPKCIGKCHRLDGISIVIEMMSFLCI